MVDIYKLFSPSVVFSVYCYKYGLFLDFWFPYFSNISCDKEHAALIDKGSINHTEQ